MKVAEEAVSAAEQLGLTDAIKNKFAYAEEQIRIALAKHGLTYDADTIHYIILHRLASRRCVYIERIPFNTMPSCS